MELTQIVQDYRPSVAPVTDKYTIDLMAILPVFLANIDVLESTKATYKRTIGLFNDFLIERNIKSPRKQHVLEYKKMLIDEGKSANTIQNYIIGVRRIFEWTAEDAPEIIGFYYPNIAKRVRGAKVSNLGHRKDALSKHQVQTIARTFDRSTLKGKRDYALYVLMVTTGARSIEVARANIGDLRIYQGELALFVQGKGMIDKSKPLKVSNHTDAAIRDYLKARGAYRDDEPLFASTSNSNRDDNISTRSIRGILKNAFRESGYDSERITGHSLRHTFATQNLLNGGTLQETQEVLGHSSITVTQRYTHNYSRKNNHSENRVDNALFQ